MGKSKFLKFFQSVYLRVAILHERPSQERLEEIIKKALSEGRRNAIRNAYSK